MAWNTFGKESKEESEENRRQITMWLGMKRVFVADDKLAERDKVTSSLS